MNTSFNVINVSLLVAGGILIYCGIKDISPKEALQEIITGSKANAKVASTGQGSAGSSFGKSGGKSGGGGGGGGSSSW